MKNTESFIAGLLVEVHSDFDAVFAEYVELGMKQTRMKDGTWKIKSYKQWKEDGY